MELSIIMVVEVMSVEHFVKNGANGVRLGLTTGFATYELCDLDLICPYFVLIASTAQ